MDKVRKLLDPMNENYPLTDIREASVAYSNDESLKLQKPFTVFDTGREILGKAGQALAQRAEDKQVLSIFEKLYEQNSVLPVFSKTEATSTFIYTKAFAEVKAAVGVSAKLEQSPKS